MEPFLAEIRILSFNFAPKGWAKCDGQLMPINQNQALFSLLGTAYGGNGQTTFALPDLRGRAPIAFTSTHPLGAAGGEATHTLTVNEMPMHTHLISGSSEAATQNQAENNVWGTSTTHPFSDQAANGTLNPSSIGQAGQSQGHPNMQPYTVVNFCIALQGIFPSRQ